MKRILILSQFFLIIFVYHILKDLKDTLVITSSDAGAEVIPFIKIWVILPFAVLSSYLFSKLYQKFGREKTLYIFVILLLTCYALFAFCLYPLRHQLDLTHAESYLKATFPVGCKGFISMICFWIYTFFYLSAELWAMMILTVLFWGYLNEWASEEQAKTFYPLCVLVGNCAGVLSGQTSRYLCKSFINSLSWQHTLQIMISIVIFCGIGIMLINYLLALHPSHHSKVSPSAKKTTPLTFKDSVLCIVKSKPLICIALLVIGFGLTTNLIEVVWKETIKKVHPLPQNYNAYVNQLTSFIGILAVVFSLFSRWIFRLFNWSQVALITPAVLFVTSFVFFFAFHLPTDYVNRIALSANMDVLSLLMTLGSLYYVSAMTAKYTIFDMCKEMAFLSIHPNERMQAKSVIDSVGSRLGKSGSSCLYQFLLLIFGSTTGSIPIVSVIAVLMIGSSVIATKILGNHISQRAPHPSIQTSN